MGVWVRGLVLVLGMILVGCEADRTQDSSVDLIVISHGGPSDLDVDLLPFQRSPFEWRVTSANQITTVTWGYPRANNIERRRISDGSFAKSIEILERNGFDQLSELESIYYTDSCGGRRASTEGGWVVTDTGYLTITLRADGITTSQRMRNCPAADNEYKIIMRQIKREILSLFEE